MERSGLLLLLMRQFLLPTSLINNRSLAYLTRRVDKPATTSSQGIVTHSSMIASGAISLPLSLGRVRAKVGHVTRITTTDGGMRFFLQHRSNYITQPFHRYISRRAHRYLGSRIRGFTARASYDGRNTTEEHSLLSLSL